MYKFAQSQFVASRYTYILDFSYKKKPVKSIIWHMNINNILHHYNTYKYYEFRA